jgi:peptidylprolyl isomerase
MMKKAIQSGDTVSVHYTGKIENGEVFDTSVGRRPLTFTVGCGQIIRGFDEAVIGMTAGEKKTVTISPEMAYGARRVELIVDIPKNTVPEDMELEKGMMIELIDPQGNKIPAEVFEILDEMVKMDLNHFLAGKTLVFDIEIVESGPSKDPG